MATTGTAKIGQRRAEGSARDNAVQRVVAIEGLCNLAVLIIKLIVGFTTGSLAIIADAVHSFSDLANNVVVWFVIRLSSQPPDREHPYGHRKFETVAVFTLAVLLSVFAIELAIHAFQSRQHEVVSTRWGFALMIAVLATNIGISVWQRRKAVELKSDILHADASHTLSDVLTTVVVIAGWQLSASGHVWLDAVCAVGVALLILYLALSLFKRVLPILVDEYAIDPGALASNVMTVPGVRSVKRMRSRWLGSSSAVDMVVTVDPQLSTAEAHEISDVIERLIGECFQVEDISVHVEPEQGSD